jgi:hypothetical protein
MLVNENRLSLADARARKWLAEPMEKFLAGAKCRRLCRRRRRDQTPEARLGAQPRQGREPRVDVCRARPFVPHQQARVGKG